MDKYPSIYFFNCPEFDNYQDDIIPLAEGLKELGIPYYCFSDYWLQSEKSGDYLFKKTAEVSFQDCDIVIFPYTWSNWVTMNRPPQRREFPPGLFDKNRKYITVYFDFNDGYQTVSWEDGFRNFDIIFRCKYNRSIPHPSNMKPWALGFSNRVIKEVNLAISPEKKHYELLSNFGASHPYEHGLRKKMRTSFLEIIAEKLHINSKVDDLKQAPSDHYDRIMWQQTNRRHSKNYYNRLNGSLLSSCFCGELVPAFPNDPTNLLKHGKKGMLKRKFADILARIKNSKDDRIIQWDSWRFWETLAAGSVAIHIDLERHGVELPSMPENFKHYVGLDIYNLDKSIDRMLDDKEQLFSIAKNGKEWVFDEYSPKAVAKRFLEKCGYSFTEQLF